MELKNEELEKLYAETFHSIKEGTILKGKVVAVRQDGVIVDIGFKSEGFIPIESFLRKKFLRSQQVPRLKYMLKA